LKDFAWDWIDENRERIIEVSDAVWEHAELGLVELESSNVLADELESHGFRVERGVAGMPSAFMGIWGNGGIRCPPRPLPESGLIQRPY
jgi:aminobenzoyl-glutamate utilization protein B